MCCTTKRLYTIEEAAVYIGRTKQAVRELIYDGKIPIVHPDRRMHLDKHDLDKWIEKNKTFRG